MYTVSGNFVEIIWPAMALEYKVETPDGIHDNYESQSIVIQGIINGVARDVDIIITPYCGIFELPSHVWYENIPASSFTRSDSDSSIIFCKTFDDAIVSGSPLIIRLQDNDGIYHYTKVYSTISASNNGTIDDIGKDLRGIDDAVLSGTPKIAEFKSSGTSYYFKIYPTISAEVENSVGITINPMCVNDAVLSGTPRIARILLNSVYYYLKVYPTKI